MLLSEHVYYVAITFKMTERVEKRICLKLCVKLKHSSAETIQVIQKDAAIHNQWLAASSQQCAHSGIMSHADFFGKTSNRPGNLAPLQPRFGALQLLALPKTKITFEREEISDRWWDLGKQDRADDGNWENCVRSQCTQPEVPSGLTCHCPMYKVSCIFFHKCLYFSYYMAWILMVRSCMTNPRLPLYSMGKNWKRFP